MALPDHQLCGGLLLPRGDTAAWCVPGERTLRLGSGHKCGLGILGSESHALCSQEEPVCSRLPVPVSGVAVSSHQGLFCKKTVETGEWETHLCPWAEQADVWLMPGLHCA